MQSAPIQFGELRNLNGIGEKIAQNIVNFLQHETTILRDVESYVKIIDVENTVTAQSRYAGQTWVITGTFETSRSEITARLERLGITVSSSISSKTDALLCGDSPGSKLDRAKKLRVKICDASDISELNVTN